MCWKAYMPVTYSILPITLTVLLKMLFSLMTLDQKVKWLRCFRAIQNRFSNINMSPVHGTCVLCGRKHASSHVGTTHLRRDVGPLCMLREHNKTNHVLKIWHTPYTIPLTGELLSQVRRLWKCFFCIWCACSTAVHTAHVGVTSYPSSSQARPRLHPQIGCTQHPPSTEVAWT